MLTWNLVKRQTRLPLHSSSQRAQVRFWGAPKDVFLSACTHSTPVRRLQPHLLALAAAEACVCVFQVRKHKCAGEIFATGQKGRWGWIRLSWLLRQRRRNKVKTTSYGEKGNLKEGGKKKRNEVGWILVPKQASWLHSPSVVWGEREAGGLKTLQQTQSALWVGFGRQVTQRGGSDNSAAWTSVPCLLQKGEQDQPESNAWQDRLPCR